MNKIAVFGSAFNPPSLGHKSVIESLTHFDRVLLIPSISHAWGKEMLDYKARCELVDVFIEDLQSSNVERSGVEEVLYKPEQSVTTFAVLTELQRQFPECAITFVIGPDNLFNFAKFYKADEILSRWSVMACPETVKVRSTDIRRALSDKKDIHSLVTPKVYQLLVEREYY
ncbi:nicotinate-nicotinamide nucleotide adenylyltransferase [Vibrio sp. Isolate25]|uniref:nicotinate-nicotinamide nucleotide adenylyltransferase n=1 Tax=Vibrio TaxID=662 RepID=UPI001EFEEA60|nr:MULTISPECIES: nicotinate-nicotinamide nucleotide adenylyltransferase [Vibrio]MCG9595373.1 nicotinate-nicotinamide nucleotide adenylyltransferase [Vibrio sp. Isolate25]MCG9681377.1 nicotinate-nicotinamide nucleotide adenylyltransferase [Vibrio sp. Isolate23]USD34465.1 nicotinate-nicotinamide nucleotide adenylyltransferase [Vibrio sp. SCSIO 43186]USD47536.1 nicotinate-nicotinamide nucleotide adenylyltransferase [Vibrio sp. SCSIO 43145]USD71590.1 nicotinate-nicotinamide nucleotide adenylyltran